tara:strand:- start:3413 stop:4435 length:1023 start_codon:yes stop_codon:yes gene_type:complete
MSKRKLNQQQQNRIASKQAAVIDNPFDTELLRGLVISHHGKEVEVLLVDSADTPGSQASKRCHFRANLPTIVCGDRVLWRPLAQTNTGIIEGLLTRDSLLQRPRPYQDPKPVAANIDTIIITLAAKPEPISSLIDRFLIAAENAKLEVCLLLNKEDLLADNPTVAAELEHLLALYSSLGYRIFRFSAQASPTSLQQQEFIDFIADKNSILVGQSGVGKSSIINVLAGSNTAKTAAISSANDKGRHTTTTSQLYPLKENSIAGSGAIIDSPGIREFGLWHLSPEAIIEGLPEFRVHADLCKFRDCEHGKSHGCALQLAFEQGKIHPSRMSSYHHILSSLDN